MGNWGATPNTTARGVPHVGANQSNVPIEMIEIDYPLRIEQYGLLADSGGAGRYRGGLAIIREYRALEDDILLSVRSDKRAYPPHGLGGGGSGGSSWNIVNPGEETTNIAETARPPGRLPKAGDVFAHQSRRGWIRRSAGARRAGGSRRRNRRKSDPSGRRRPRRGAAPTGKWMMGSRSDQSVSVVRRSKKSGGKNRAGRLPCRKRQQRCQRD